MEKIGFIYILANQNNTVLYIGVASDLVKRVQEHKEHRYGGFTKKYNVTKLVYYETLSSIESAIEREKQIKSGSRQNKNNLINSINPEWKELYFDISGFEK